MKLKPQALVLDDDPFFRKTIEVVLGGLGMNVKAVGSVADFLSELSVLSPDLLLIDVQVGEENGLLLVETLRQQGNNIPIVVISGNQDPSTTTHALEIGANDYILKPFDKMLLGAKLLQFVNTPELEDQGKLLKQVDGKGVAAKVQFQGKITEVDEMGVRFLSVHLIPKGAVIKIGGAFLASLDGAVEECLVNVTQTQLNSSLGMYEIYAEFEGVDVDFLRGVRKWITAKKSAST